LSVLKNFLMRRGYLGLSRKKSWDEEENYMLRRFII